MAASCAGEVHQIPPASEELRLITSSLEAVARNRSLLGRTDAISSEARAALYDAAGSELEGAEIELRAMMLPAELDDLRQAVIQTLMDDRNAWSHLALEARTGQADHGALAEKLFGEVQDRWPALLEDLRKASAARGEALDEQALKLPPGPGEVAGAQSSPGAAPAPQPAFTVPPPSTPMPTPIPAPEPPAAPATPGRPESTAAATAAVPTAALPTVTSPTQAASPAPTRAEEPARAPTPASTVATAPTPARSPVPPTPPAPPPATPTLPPGASIVIWQEDAPVISSPDWLGRPAIIIHWVVQAGPNAVTAVEYPFVAGDEIQIDITVEIEGRLSELPSFSLVSPARELVRSGPIRGLYLARGLRVDGGTHRLLFDNSGDDRNKTVHLLVTYHQVAPGAKAPQGGS